MSSSRSSTIPEGYGGPISINQSHGSPIDPTLESCCQREIESNRQFNAVQSAVRRHDRIAWMERLRRNAVQLDFGQGCRCSFDPSQDGGEYGTLREMRLRRYHEQMEEQTRAREEGNYNGTDDNDDNNNNEEQEDQVNNNRPFHADVDRNDKSDNSDSDSEFDYLLDEIDLPPAVTEELERRRREELEEAILYRDLLTHHGYGTHRQMHPMRVLRAAGLTANNSRHRGIPESAVVLHLYDPESDMSAALDLLLEQDTFAGKYRGTKFLRASGRAVLLMNPDIADKELPHLHPNRDMPALVAIKDGVVVATCPKLAGMGSSEEGTVDVHAVEHWLDMAGVLRTDPPPIEMLCRIRPEEDALLASGILGRKTDASTQKTGEGGTEEYFNCGVLGCEKTFFHEHVGVRNEEQDGLVVKEDGTIKDF